MVNKVIIAGPASQLLAMQTAREMGVDIVIVNLKHFLMGKSILELMLRRTML
jgi:hypothetical protein